jgi:hypothetical protein
VIAAIVLALAGRSLTGVHRRGSHTPPDTAGATLTLGTLCSALVTHTCPANSPHVHERASSTAIWSRTVHSSSGVRGVGPARQDREAALVVLTRRDPRRIDAIATAPAEATRVRPDRGTRRTIRAR